MYYIKSYLWKKSKALLYFTPLSSTKPLYIFLSLTFFLFILILDIKYQYPHFISPNILSAFVFYNSKIHKLYPVEGKVVGMGVDCDLFTIIYNWNIYLQQKQTQKTPFYGEIVSAIVN